MAKMMTNVLTMRCVTQITKLNDNNLGIADVTPRNIDVRGVETSDSQQNNSSLCNDEGSSVLKHCQDTDTEQLSQSLNRSVRATLGTYDDQKSQIDGTEDAFKASVIEKVAGTINIGCEKLRRSRSAVSCRQPKSFRHFTTQRSSTVDPKIMLQNFQWDQYEMIQESLLRTVSCEIKKCESEETLTKKIAEIKSKFQNTVDQLNDQLMKSVMKTGHANERIKAGLNNKGKIVLSDANDKLLELEKNRIQDLHDIPLSTTNEIRSKSDGDKLTNYAKELQSLISKKVTVHVSSLLSLKIQQYIIVFNFECQKSFVLKQNDG
ncbi:unnamed protein product [Mytilus edulis]|uniref:Uncharacterized protein n=1 Tax=Mytilus edulis TaxID=6550 RepID=A0A8S3Q6P5_MYTED|nr:unnamed protein product [Mytilus edulis]